MNIPIFQIHAFTDSLFHGNPAAVCVLPHWLPDDDLQKIAHENNLPVTAFLVIRDGIHYIRWVTPEYELDLCGHGSLSAAYVIFNFLSPHLRKVNLHSRIESLAVVRDNDLITLDFPAKDPEPCLLPQLECGLGLIPLEVYRYQNERCIAVLRSEFELQQLEPIKDVLLQLPCRGVTITAPGTDTDFVSRTFYPQKSNFEDAVTGAAHCILAPYWSKRLRKTELHARQLSRRGGYLRCLYENERVLLTGSAVTYLRGQISV